MRRWRLPHTPLSLFKPYNANSELIRVDRPNVVNPIAADAVASWDMYEYDGAGLRIAHANAAGRVRHGGRSCLLPPGAPQPEPG